MAAHLLLANSSMQDSYFFNADGELLIVAQEGSLRFHTEFGVIAIEPGEVCIIPRGVIFRCELAGATPAPMSARITAASSPCPIAADRRQLPRQCPRLPHPRRKL